MNGQERIVAALNRQPVDRTPVWFMRQAGRHLPEYRKLAAEHSFWERCQDLDLCTNITMQPIHRYGSIDAAIVFSDICGYTAMTAKDEKVDDPSQSARAFYVSSSEPKD